MDTNSFFDTNKWQRAGELLLDPRPASVVDPRSLPLTPTAIDFIVGRHPEGIYDHQEQALRAALHRQNVCVATGTSSGKSLIFQATAVQLLSEDPTSRILAIYPAKALGTEQEERWRRALAEAGIAGKVARIDGSVPVKTRAGLIKGARVVIVTPDIIHAWLMTSIAVDGVRSFLAALKLVVVDEIHTYTGVFGSNGAFLFRRLQHLLGFLMARPQWIAASATLGDAHGLLAQLFGLDFTVIGPEDDSSGRQPVTIKLVRPPEKIDNLSAVASLLEALAASDSRRFIAFVDSRKQTEQLAAIIERSAKGNAEQSEDEEDEIDEELSDRLGRLSVLPYRAGYEPQDRALIQRRLSSGDLPGIVSTSALELGLDIPTLDTAVLVGVPRSSTSLHQRIGRIGRHTPGEVIVVSSGDLYDEAIFAEPEKLLSRPHVEPALYLENRRIQYIHALCLARAGGEHDSAVKLEGGHADRPLTSSVVWPEGFLDLCEQERTGQIPAGLQGMKVEASGESPNHAFPLRDVERQFKIEIRSRKEQRSLGTVSHSQLLREAYPGAVHYYAARPYRVASVKLDAKSVRVREERAYHTKPTPIPTQVYPNYEGDALFNAVRRGDLDVVESEVQIREALCGYRERRGASEFPVNYPTDSEKTGVFWFQPYFGRTFFSSAVTISHPALDGEPGAANASALYLYEAFLMVVPVERRDVGVAVDRHRVARGPLTEGRRFVALYDQTYGSLRISGRVFEADLLQALVENAVELCVEDAGSPEAEAARPVLEAMQSSLREADGERWWGGTTTPPTNATQVRVIMPGSVGLQLLHENREFHVEGVLYTPQQGLVYRGFHNETAYGAKEIIPVDQVAPLQGVSKLGHYSLETGELERETAETPVA